MKEIWKDIAGYDGAYQVSNLGRVKSLSRSYITGSHSAIIHVAEKIMRQKVRKNGYCLVALSKKGKATDKYVHRLVACAFIDNPNGYDIINHKDRNPSNNCVGNLEWCTQQYNTVYENAHLEGAKKRMKPIIQKGLSGKIIKIWDCAASAAKIFPNKFASHNINNALKNEKRKMAYGYIWEYYK